MRYAHFFPNIGGLLMAMLFMFPSISQAQLFDDMKPRETILDSRWMYGFNVAAVAASYSFGTSTMDADIPTGERFDETTMPFGYRVEGYLLYNANFLYVGPVVSYEHLYGRNRSVLGNDFSYRIGSARFGLHAEFPLLTSSSGAIYMSVEFGGLALVDDGTLLGSGQSPVLMYGGYGIGYQINIGEHSSLNIGFTLDYTRFRNDFNGLRLTHSLFPFGLKTGLRFG